MRNYNFAHAISSIPDAAIARGVDRRADIFCVRTGSYGFFAGTSPEPAARGIDRGTVA